MIVAWQRYANRQIQLAKTELLEGVSLGSASSPSFRTKSIVVLSVSLALAGVAVGYSKLRSDSAKSGPQSLAPNILGATSSNVADVDTMIARLVARLEQNPDDGEGFRMLGWAYLMTDRPAEAIAPYQKAVALMPDDASAHTGYGEALTAMNDGAVSEMAFGHFRNALEIDRSDVRARYFAAKFDYQSGRKRQALDDWIALANEVPTDAGWQANLRREISTVASELGIDVSERLAQNAPAGAETIMPVLDQRTIDAASQLPAEDQRAMIDRMVNGLAARLASNPNDPDGWARLIRSRTVRGDFDQASKDLAMARKALAGNNTGLSRVNATASELGIR